MAALYHGCKLSGLVASLLHIAPTLRCACRGGGNDRDEGGEASMGRLRLLVVSLTTVKWERQ